MNRLPIARSILTSASAVVAASAATAPARADCVTSPAVPPLTTICDTTAPNPYTTTIGTGRDKPDEPNEPKVNTRRTVRVLEGATVSTGNANAISLDRYANITVDGVVENKSVDAPGLQGGAGNTIEFNGDGLLTVGKTGKVVSMGSQVAAEAVNVFGTNNTIINKGLINSYTGVAIWAQNVGTLNIVNDGEISVGVTPTDHEKRNAIGSVAIVDFTNRGKVYGSLLFGRFDDTLRLYDGSKITGNINGGEGIDTMYLNGVQSATLEGGLNGFEYLNKEDAGTWTLTGSIDTLIAANVKGGTLILTGNNTAFTGMTTVSKGATLQGSAQSLPNARGVPSSITNEGLVRFDQVKDGTYLGVITGSGGLEKTGTGTLTMANALAYGGDTSVKAGTLVLTGDNSRYAGLLNVSSGTVLQGQAVSLGTRISTDGLVRFTQDSTASYAGRISGTGNVEKTGSGSLTLSAPLGYSGTTAVKSGTLILTGDNRNYAGTTLVSGGAVLQGTGQSVGRKVDSAGTVRFNQVADGSYDGQITGSGNVEKMGNGALTMSAALAHGGSTAVKSGTLILTGDNSQYAGLASVSSGATLQGTAGGMVGKVSNEGLVRFAQSSDGVYAGQITGKGNLEKTGAGVLTISSSLGYGGDTAVNAGTLALTGDNSRYAGTATVAAGATLQGRAQNLVSKISNSGIVRFAQTDAGSYAGAITGSGQVEKTGAGDLTLTPALAYEGDTLVKQGRLILTGDNGSYTGQAVVSAGATLQGQASSVIGTVVNDGLLRFDQAGTGIYDGQISGGGVVEKTGTGLLTLTGNLGYGGDTRETQGTLVLGGDNRAYAGLTTVSSGATLQGRAKGITRRVKNDGLVRFDESGAGFYAGLISGAGGVEKTGAGLVEIATAQTYTGATDILAGSLLLSGSLTSPTTIASGATLMGTGLITGTVSNEGSISPGRPDAIGTLTIDGNYVGRSGSLLTGVGGVPTAPVADLLRITGAGHSASGTTAVFVTDRGGLGAPTTGNGIEVVDAANGAQTGAQAFALGARAAGGAYEYRLVRGATPGTAQNWYLISKEDPVVPDEKPPVDPGKPPVDPGKPPQPEKPLPDKFRVETGAYTALPALQRLYSYALVDTLQQRRGDIGPGAAGAADPGHVVWGRAGGNLGRSSAADKQDIELSYDLGFLQAGLDVVEASDGRGGRVYSGVFLASGTSRTDTETGKLGDTGNASFTAYSGGIYGTWFGASGAYADALAQVTRLSDATAHSTGAQQVSTKGWSQSVSLEAGYRLAFGKGLSLTPQGQLIAENFSLDDTADSFGQVAFDNGPAARGRLGLALGGSLDGLGSKTDLLLRANLWHVFAGSAETTFSNVNGDNPVGFAADTGSSWLAIDAGFTTALSDSISLFGNAGYEYGLSGTRQAASGRLGLAVSW